MHSSLLEHLVDPVSRAPLAIGAATAWNGEEILEGTLRSPDGREYPIRTGIPRFIDLDDDGQRRTRDTFAYKWQREQAFAQPETREWARAWLVERYGFEDAGAMRAHLGGHGRILDAGCGGGYSASLWLEPGWTAGSPAEYVGVDISTAVDVARERLGSVERVHFVQADLLQLPFAADTFGAVFAEGVLHHTPSTEQALASVLSTLAAGGEVLAYVYRKKGPIREATDELVRELVSPLPPDQALEQLRPLTLLAKALAETEATVRVEEDVPLLGIPAGEHSVQRLVYWHFLKAFWNDAFSLEANNLVNFDWFHPVYAHRHTEDEVRGWCDLYGLSLQRLDAQLSGFTLRAVKGAQAAPAPAGTTTTREGEAAE